MTLDHPSMRDTARAFPAPPISWATLNPTESRVLKLWSLAAL